MSGYALTRRDTQRLADYVRRSEARRPKEGQGGGQLPQLRDIQFFACTSEPNIEAIEDGGNWPHTVEAIPLLKSEGFTLNNIRGACNEFSGGGGGGCGRGGCIEGANLEVVQFVPTAVTVTLTWGGVINAGTPNEEWSWTGNGITAKLTFRANPNTNSCSPPVTGTACTTFEMWVTTADSGLYQGYWTNTAVMGEVCDGPFRVITVNGGQCGDAGADVFWVSGASTSVPAASEIDGDSDTYGGDRKPVPVFMSRLMNGALFFGEVFPATNIGGMWYAVGAHHSFISGRRTNRVTPHTFWMDVCENEVPFIYWPDNTITAKEDTRHLVGWVSAKRKYVMVAMGGCDV